MSRILVVDDDWLVCSALKAVLETAGHKVVIADGAAAGLKALEDVSFSLMIVDIFMPHMRGLESISLFHKSAPRLPLVAISGYKFAEPRTQAPDFLNMALKLGASHCLKKPFTTSALLYIVGECLKTNIVPELLAPAI
ncbi:response regulator [Bradyrhizobium sp. YR681]|uniref:response regulator n=1 Tax=Bradyrhizobium sp. YR681 TaxID=1144344 RepID=UPI0002D7AFB3|nr:response regulator [Bradyrhizobium sp. YR681]